MNKSEFIRSTILVRLASMNINPWGSEITFNNEIQAQTFAVNLMASGVIEFEAVSKMVDWFKRENYEGITVALIVDFVEKQDE